MPRVSHGMSMREAAGTLNTPNQGYSRIGTGYAEGL